MKKRRLIAAVLACATVLSTSAMMMISNQAAGSAITRKGSVTVHVKENTTQKQMKGVEFSCYKIMNLDVNDMGLLYSEPAAGFEEVLDGIEADELNTYSAKEIEKLSQELKETAENVSTKIVLETDETGIVSFENLPMGYYLFVETAVPNGYTAGKSFIVSVPTADTTGGEITDDTWDFDIDVYVKHEKISVEKELSEATSSNGLDKNVQDGSVAKGDYVQYTVKTAIPDFSEDYFYKNEAEEYLHDVVFDISDVMSDGLTIQNTEKHPVKVIVGGKVAIEGTDYQITANERKESNEADLEIKFTNDFLENNVGKEVVVTYYAYVNDDAVMGTAGNDNTVTLEYSNNPTEETTIKTSNEDSTVDVYTFGLEILKFTKEDGTKPLSGAEFNIYSNHSEDGLFKEGVVSDENGKIEIPVVDEGIYYIEETKAPEGYTPLLNRIEVEIIAEKDAQGHATGSYTLIVNNNEITTESGEYVTIKNSQSGISTIAVENHKGFTLPETGGNGVKYFVLAGAVGMASLIIGVSKKNKRM